MAPRGNLLLPSPAAFRSRDRGPQLTISGRVFLAGRAKRWEAQVRFASPISAVLGITDAACPRGEGSGAWDSVPAAGPRLGVRGQREFECRRGRKAVPHRPHPRCSVPVGWGRGRPDGCPDMARRHRVKAGPRGSAGEARWAAPRQRPGPRPAPRRPPRFAFAPRPLGDAQAASVEEARVPRRARGRAPGREGPRTHASESAGRALGAAGPHVAGKTGSTPSRHSDPAPGGYRGGYHRPSATPVRRGIPGGRGEALSRAEASGCQEDVREARGHPTQGRGQGRAPAVEGPRALPVAGAARLCCGRSHRTGTGAHRPRGPRGPSSLLCPLRAPGGRLLLDVGEVTAATTAPEWPTSGMAGPAPRAPAGCWRSQPRARRW